jgi:flagella basal body P-ring formation protein FlgA
MRLALRFIVLAWVLASCVPARAAVASDARAHDAVVAAIAAAVRQRVGDDAEVIVDSVEIFIPAASAPAARIDAAPDPAARLGGVVRFALMVDGARTGHAEAQVHVVVEQARATRLVARGATIGAGDAEDVRGEIVDGPLHRRPRAGELAGGRALRDLPAGVVIPAQAVLAAPAVRTGQTITVMARAFGIEARATMVAAESGNPGSVIRVVNRATRKVLRARVVSSEVVEIIHD